MDLKFFLNSIKYTFLDPNESWEAIDSENVNVPKISKGFLIPLITLVSLSAVCGSYLFTNVELSPVYSLLVGIKSFILLIIVLYSSAFLIKEITYPLDLGRDFGITFRIVAYSLVPLLLCQLLSRFFESLQFINIIGLYGMYIFWIGTEKMLNPPKYKKMPLLIAASITVVVLYILTNSLLNMLTDRIYDAFFS